MDTNKSRFKISLTLLILLAFIFFLSVLRRPHNADDNVLKNHASSTISPGAEPSIGLGLGIGMSQSNATVDPVLGHITTVIKQKKKENSLRSENTETGENFQSVEDGTDDFDPVYAPVSLEEVNGMASSDTQSKGSAIDSDSDPSNPSWPAKTETTLHTALAEIQGTSQFSIAQLYCKDAACKAKIVYENGGRDNAKLENFASLHSISASCLHGISLPNPTDNTSKFEVEITIDCATRM